MEDYLPQHLSADELKALEEEAVLQERNLHNFITYTRLLATDGKDKEIAIATLKFFSTSQS